MEIPINLNLIFLKFVWNFRDTNRPVILKILNENKNKNIIIIKNHQDKKR